MSKLCRKIASSSKYSAIQPRLCQLEEGHKGRHAEFPFLTALAKTDKGVANKIKRDATMTTGAAWKSEKAGPNRILRWVMLLPDKELLKYGLNLAQLGPLMVRKLKEKAASYDACMEVAKKLTWLAYQMPGAPAPSEDVRAYLEAHFGTMTLGSTNCLICKGDLPFRYFSDAVRGRAYIETAHSDPRSHSARNVGFAHRECNIAQGDKSLGDFYQWLREILSRVE